MNKNFHSEKSNHTQIHSFGHRDEDVVVCLIVICWELNSLNKRYWPKHVTPCNVWKRNKNKMHNNYPYLYPLLQFFSNPMHVLGPLKLNSILMLRRILALIPSLLLSVCYLRAFTYLNHISLQTTTTTPNNIKNKNHTQPEPTIFLLTMGQCLFEGVFFTIINWNEWWTEFQRRFLP